MYLHRPPYGIKFNSNFQWSTTSRDVRDGNLEHMTREPEQVKAFRDTWRDKIHSYLTYLRDRLTVARDLLAESGSIFVQIGDENVHRVRALMDEVFGDDNFVSLIALIKTGGLSQSFIKNKCDYIIWYSKQRSHTKTRKSLQAKAEGEAGASKYTGVELPNGVRMTVAQAEKVFGLKRPKGSRTFRLATTTSEANPVVEAHLRTGSYRGRWKTTVSGMYRLELAGRIHPSKSVLNYVRYIEDYPVQETSNVWDDIGGIQSRSDPKVYVVQTATEAVKRCVLMTTDPGDLVLDPLVEQALLPTSQSSGAVAGSPLTLLASPSRWPEPVSWAPAIPTTFSPIAKRGNSSRRKSSAECHRSLQPMATFAKASFTSVCRTSPCGPSPTTRR